MIEREDQLGGRRLAPGERFRFRCRPGLACFNTCCRDKRLPLLPYDLLRLRRGLGLQSEEVLQRHTVLELDPGSGWPALRLALKPDGRCPFVESRGCAVYAHRPTCCRVYPLARAVRAAGGGVEEAFLITDTPGCLGWQEPDELDVGCWVQGQGLGPYQVANNRAAGFFLHPARRRPMALSERQVHGVVLALYNLDTFRQVVSSPGFVARFGLEPSAARRAEDDDEALLDLGIAWITGQFFGADG